MIRLSIPGKSADLEIAKLLLDINGTLTTDGVLIAGVKEKLEKLKDDLEIYLLTADTLGTAAGIAEELDIELLVVNSEDGGQDKLDIMNTLDAEQSTAIGNGYNDSLMLEHAALGIAVLGEEGCSIHAAKRADILVRDINDALALLLNPQRIVATLRV